MVPFSIPVLDIEKNQSYMIFNDSIVLLDLDIVTLNLIQLLNGPQIQIEIGSHVYFHLECIRIVVFCSIQCSMYAMGDSISHLWLFKANTSPTFRCRWIHVQSSASIIANWKQRKVMPVYYIWSNKSASGRNEILRMKTSTHTCMRGAFIM